MNKVLYVYGGAEFHPTKAEGELLSGLCKSDGRFQLDMTDDLDALARLPGSGYAAVVLNATGFHDDLTPEREKGLLQFVVRGGGLVGLHSAADLFGGSRAFTEMLGCKFKHHPEWQSFKVTVTNHDHYMTTRLPDFTIGDEMYQLQDLDPAKMTVLAEATWQGQRLPMAYVKEYGQGRVAYLANGHDLRAWSVPAYQKLVIRAIAWCTGATKPAGKVRVGLLGYGASFNMGRGHTEWMSAIEGFEVVAMCDTAPARVEAAKKELPGLKGYFTNLDDMLAMPDLDLVIVILPHNQHAEAAIRCSRAGKHVITEKPFCLNVAEADAMIGAAHSAGKMLSVFHNRRWDDDYLAIKDLIARGLIGDVFRIESFQGNYGHPGFWWRSSIDSSGGVMYDWGAHILDWILGLVKAPIVQITGDLQKRVWHDVTNEDHGEAWIRFANGVTADVVMSNITAASRPKWQIYGTKGSIEYDWHSGNVIKLNSSVSGVMQQGQVKFANQENAWAEYYRNIADHLLFGEELVVKPEQARRVIGVMEAVARSAAAGTSVPPLPGCE